MLKELIDIIRQWIESKKTGSIQINFFKGGVANLVKKESIKLTDSTTRKRE